MNFRRFDNTLWMATVFATCRALSRKLWLRQILNAIIIKENAFEPEILGRNPKIFRMLKLKKPKGLIKRRTRVLPALPAKSPTSYSWLEYNATHGQRQSLFVSNWLIRLGS